VMTIGWGLIGEIWRKRLFIVPVRPSRYTFEIIKEKKAFTVCVPHEGTMKKELAVCGTESGRNVDKIEKLGLVTQPGRTVDCPVLSDCAMVYECKVIYSQALDENSIPPISMGLFYPGGDIHSMFYGEIQSFYALE